MTVLRWRWWNKQMKWNKYQPNQTKRNQTKFVLCQRSTTEWACRDWGRRARTSRCCADRAALRRRLKMPSRRSICLRQNRAISASNSCTRPSSVKNTASKSLDRPATSTSLVPTLKNVIDGAIGKRLVLSFYCYFLGLFPFCCYIYHQLIPLLLAPRTKQ